ncbi:MAG: Kelch repeat-containing protein, partial [Nitrospiraceae bacterium]
ACREHVFLRQWIPSSSWSVTFFLMIGLLFGLPTSAQEIAPVWGTWKPMAPAPTKRTEVSAAAVEGKIYVVGGFTEPTISNLKDLTISAIVEEYDPSTDQWTAKSPLPVGLHHAGIGVAGDRLYIIGGFTQSFLSIWKPVATVYQYNPTTDEWTERAPMPTVRGALAVTEIDGKLLAIGGYDDAGNSAAVEEYDPAGNTWMARAALPTPRDHLAAATIGRRVYAIGGRRERDYGQNLTIAEAYDPASDRWTRVADLPTARSGITAGVIEGRIYVLGGESPEGTFSANEAYLADQDRWEKMAPMPTPRHGLGSAVVDHRLYVIAGGPKPGGSYSNVNEMFAPPNGREKKSGGGRASSTQVGAVMALLATFQDAGALPAESSVEANRLIKALIQFQAAFLKSDNPAVKRLFADALVSKLGHEASSAIERFQSAGWTSEILEAVIEFADSETTWQDARLQEGFRDFNIGQTDFHLLARIFRAARSHLAAKGKDLHMVYASRRRDMPGAGL